MDAQTDDQAILGTYVRSRPGRAPKGQLDVAEETLTMPLDAASTLACVRRVLTSLGRPVGSDRVPAADDQGVVNQNAVVRAVVRARPMQLGRALVTVTVVPAGAHAAQVLVRAAAPESPLLGLRSAQRVAAEVRRALGG